MMHRLIDLFQSIRILITLSRQESREHPRASSLSPLVCRLDGRQTEEIQLILHDVTITTMDREAIQNIRKRQRSRHHRRRRPVVPPYGNQISPRHEGPLLPLLQFYPTACCYPLSTAYVTGASSWRNITVPLYASHTRQVKPYKNVTRHGTPWETVVRQILQSRESDSNGKTPRQPVQSRCVIAIFIAVLDICKLAFRGFAMNDVRGNLGK